MEKTKKFIEDSFEKSEDLYWEWNEKLSLKKKEVHILQQEIEWMKKDVDRYDAERKHYQELLNEINTTPL